MTTPLIRRLIRIVVIALLAFALLHWCAPVEEMTTGNSAVLDEAALPSGATGQYPEFLPPEAVSTLGAIEAGGPFRYAQDGGVFRNREGLLPQQARGYYREYTVETPGAGNRGARRIVSGGHPPEVYYYTDDHYRSFRRVEPGK